MADVDQLPDPDDETRSIDLQAVRRFVGNLWTYKWLLLLVGAVAIALAVVHTKRQTPLYQASTSFLLDPRPPQILGYEIHEAAPMGTSPWDSNRQEYYNAQLHVLRSRMLAERTVKLGKLAERPEIIGDTPITEDNLAWREKLATSAVLGGVAISGPNSDRVLRVSATHRNAKAAALIANTHVEAYLDFNLSLRSEGSENASEWLGVELDKAEGDLRTAELDVFKFKKDNELLYVSLEDQRNLVTANIKRYTDAVNDARVKRIEAEQYLRRIEAARRDPLLESAIFDLAQSETGRALKGQYYEAVQKLEELGQVYGPKHPEVAAQKTRVAKLLGSLESEADILVKSASEDHAKVAATERAFSGELEKHKAEAFELGPKEVDYNRLVRREKSDEERFRVVLDRLRDSELTGRLTTVNVRILDPAVVPRAPISPSLRANLLMGGVLALVFGPGLVLLITLLDRRISSPDELESLVKVPLLGIVPKAHDAPVDIPLELLVHHQPTAPLAEGCRNLRTNLLYAGADEPIRSLVITSPNEREGKTTLAMYIGTVVAQGEKRVVLVESDLRRPRLAKVNGVANQRGLSNLILGEIGLDDAIKSTEVPGLYLLPAGPPPPNPSELLMTKRFGDILAELEERFDLVLLDSPPVLAVTDASILARRADSTLLLVKSEQTLRDTARRAMEQLNNVDAKVSGVVLNALDLKKRVYGYTYGYGYASATETAESQT